MESEAVEADFCRQVREFSRMQEKHRLALLGENVKDVCLWEQERELMFRRLLRGFDNFRGSGGKGFSDTTAGLVKELLDAEDELLRLVAEWRQRMGARLAMMRKGRDVLSGYSLNRGHSQAPRFLSSRT